MSGEHWSFQDAKSRFGAVIEADEMWYRPGYGAPPLGPETQPAQAQPAK